MNSIILTPKTPEELAFLANLLKRLNVDIQVLSEEEKEDLGLAMMMRDVNRNEKVSRDEIIVRY